MSVYLSDLSRTPQFYDVFQNFTAGAFTVKKSDRVFSNIGEDQAHEQHSKILKIDGGSIGILENEDALQEYYYYYNCRSANRKNTKNSTERKQCR